jgi:hypothetical protein
VKIVSESADDRDGWRKSSYSSSAGGSCVEAKSSQGAVFLRDSKNQLRDQPVVAVPSIAWSSFIHTLTDSPE